MFRSPRRFSFLPSTVKRLAEALRKAQFFLKITAFSPLTKMYQALLLSALTPTQAKSTAAGTVAVRLRRQ